MRVSKTNFEGLLIIEPRVLQDARGFFFESYNDRTFREAGIDARFVQDNNSHSWKNVVRGLHFQNEPQAQAKLIWVQEGRILDVAVDLRKNQPTFRRVFTIELSSEKAVQVFLPKGFAHGFSVLSDFARISYKCDALYSPQHEGGINIDDPDLAIDWKVPKSQRIVSEKDMALPRLKEARFNFSS